MPTFDGQTKTRTRVKLDRDAFQPNMGSLVGSPYTEEANVHGHRNHLIGGNFTEEIRNNLKTTVDGSMEVTVAFNQKTNVGQDQTEVIIGTKNETILGPHIITTMNVFNETRIGAHIQAHGGIEWVHDSETQFHYGGLNFQIYANIFEVEIDHYEAAANHLEFKGTHSYFSINDNTAVLFQFQTKPLNVEADVTEAKIYALECEVMALGARAGALEGHLVPLKANAGARVGADTPFGG